MILGRLLPGEGRERTQDGGGLLPNPHILAVTEADRNVLMLAAAPGQKNESHVCMLQLSLLTGAVLSDEHTGAFNQDARLRL